MGDLLTASLSGGSIAGCVFLSLFLLFGIIQLVFAFLMHEKGRMITKPFCVLFLALAVCLFLPDHPLIYVAAFLGAVGDLLLLFKSEKIFSVGVLSFFVGHLLYYAEILFVFLGEELLPWWSYLLFVLAVLLLAPILIFPLGKFIKNRLTLFGGAFYAGLLLTGVIIVSVAISRRPASELYLTLFGYLFFIVSDAILIKTRYERDFPRRDFPIMLFYLLAQLLIVGGFLLSYLTP